MRFRPCFPGENNLAVLGSKRIKQVAPGIAAAKRRSRLDPPLGMP
jgi:hypothetical protein